MAAVDFAALTSPISEVDPCGPDLELAGHAEYMMFMARIEGVLPKSFLDDGKPFDRSTIDFDAEFAAIGRLLNQSRDIRLLAILAKLLMLNRDVAGFESCIRFIATLLEQHWDDVHPRGEDGDFTVRNTALESLDDPPHVVMPLQYVPLLEDRRHGPIVYRNVSVAAGETTARDGEQTLDPATIDKAFKDVELAKLIETRGLFEALQADLGRIRNVCLDRAGGEQMARLERLPGLTAKMLVFLDAEVTKRDASAALAPSTGAPTEGVAAADAAAEGTAVGKVRSNSDAAGALAAVADYFSRCEPSNPALLLVRQAEQLIGKTFLEVMRILVPTHVEQAAINIGREHVFKLPIERLAQFSESAQAAPDGGGAGGNGAAEPRRFEVASRREAIGLLEQIGAYYRAAEPSSPVPYLADRARSFAERDFMSLLKDLLPDATLGSQ